MQFMRDNIFFAVLAGVFLLSLIIFIPVKMGQGTTYQERVALRQKVIDDCDINNRRPYVDEKTVEEGEKSLAEIKEQAVRVDQTTSETNRRNYKPLMLIKSDGTKIAAFPIDRDVYKQYGLDRIYTRQYREAIQDVIDKLAPTSPPTQDEIDKEIKTQTAIIEAEEEYRKRVEAKDEASTSEAPKITPRDGSPGLPDGDISRSAASGASDSKDPKYLGTLYAKMSRTEKGLIYVDMDAIQLVFPVVKANPNEAELWDAEISRWIFTDILEAIKQTNDQSLSAFGTSTSTSVKKPTVLNSGIKRLVSMSVDSGYVTPYTSTQQRPSGGSSPAMRPTHSIDIGPRSGRSSRSTATGKQTGSGLTRRISCQDYDVVHYSFTVIMSMNHLLTLQQKLLERNLHTILGVRIVEVVQAEDDLYYYGRDPVMQVTINGELQLLTEWTRGTWDKKARKWSSEFPPLVPVDVLKQEVMKSALRNEDKERVKAQGKTR